MSEGIAAGVVAFRPDAERLASLAEAAAGETTRLFVFINASNDDELCARLQALGATVLPCVVNLGVAEAQNMLALAAALANFERLLLLDQDSTLAPGMITALAAEMDALQRAGRRPAVIGPRIASPRGEEDAYKPPRYFPLAGEPRSAHARPVRYVIASGSLIDLAAWRRIGPMRSDYFIDAVDVEWCFRSWARGYSCWVREDVTMEHRIGRGVVRRTLLAPAFPDQAPFRLYAYVRNQVYGLRLRHIPLLWRLRFLLHAGRLALSHSLWRPKAGADAGLFLRAFVAGLRGRLGPPPGAEAVQQFEEFER